MTRFAIALILACLCLVSEGAAAAAISITMDKSPDEQGIHLFRDRVSAEDVSIDGKTTAAWVSGHGSVPADEWARSFLLTVTDPRFKNGKMPAVDIEVTYLHEANTKVELVADTATGSRVVGSGWGNQKAWQTLKVRLDDAHFGARQHGNQPKLLPSDGFDLRVNAFAGNFRLRSVKITSVERTTVADWTRFISVDQVRSTSKFIVEPGANDAISFDIHNRALAPARGIAQWKVMEGGGKVLETREEKIEVAANSVATLKHLFASADRAVGEYAVRLTLLIQENGQTLEVAKREQPLAIAGPEDLFIIFDKEPIMRGMDFDRTSVGPQQVNVGGTMQWAWRATFGSQRGGEGWWKSFVFNITDPRFANGGRPAVDVIVNYRHVANAPMNLFADTASGSRRVAEGWGRNESWQRMFARIDDARLADTQYGSDPKELKTDGFDLRVNFNTGEGELRSIFIRGYPLDKPDLNRLLRFDSVDAGRDLFIFEPGEKSELRLKLTNLARKPVEALCTVRLVDDLENELWSNEQTTTITPSSAFEVLVPFKTAGLKQGVYTIRLSLGHNTEKGYRALIERDVNVMISEKSSISKASDGEFLYGLDMGVESFDERWLQWCDFMGVDILRGPGHGHNHVDEGALRRAFEIIGRHKLRSSQFFDIPWHEDPAQRGRLWEELARKVETITREFGDRVRYYELGNEPDLTFFYPGPIEDYAKGYEIISRAIKVGDPDSVVMNGGLCFAGKEGDGRARRFIEVVNMDTLDAWAYHAHGPGAGSERDAVQRLRSEAAKWDKDKRPLVETESGVSARTPAQLRIQARTAVQKMVYAQSANVPAFMWFRLFITGGDGDYTNLKNVHEPRSVVLSYRTMTRTLKGLRFVRMVSLADSEQEAYLFAETNGTRRALVWWTSGRGGSMATLNLGAAVSDLQRIDLFGNIIAIAGAEAGIVSIPTENDPSFLTWTAGNATAEVTVIASALVAPALVQVTPGGVDVIEATIRNDTDHAIDATLVLRVGDESQTEPQQDQYVVQVPARSIAPVRAQLQTSAAATNVDWPARWIVYTDVPSDIDLAKFTSVPLSIDVGGKTYLPRVARLQDQKIDLAVLAGGFKERAEAICFAQIDSSVDQTIRVGASADWWMAWFANGQLLCSTIDSGNGGAQSILTHQFDMPLKKGRNLIAVRVQSGSMGFTLTSAGPRELKASRSSGGEIGDNLSLELNVAGATIARQSVAVQRRHAIAALPADSTSGALAASEPAGDFVEQNVVNEWAKQPDSTRWWKGETDLSGSIWLFADEKSIQMLVRATDDLHRDGDNLELVLAGETGEMLRINARTSGARIERVEEGRDAKTTWYRVTIDRQTLPGKRLSINARLIDDDFGGLKQYGAWCPWNSEPTQWYQAFVP